MTAKGTHIGLGGRVVKMIVTISYGKGVNTVNNMKN